MSRDISEQIGETQSTARRSDHGAQQVIRDFYESWRNTLNGDTFSTRRVPR